MLVQHGTTRKRAEAILERGPDSQFQEPGAQPGCVANGFSAAPVLGAFPLGDPSTYASNKAEAFPQEGGPAILEIEVPDEMIGRIGRPEEGKAHNYGGEIRFEPGYGLEALLRDWSRLQKGLNPP